jgi:prepilin-type N-terminal cleavage/methylation domain-containing protein
MIFRIRRQRVSAFTLVELMVTIGIIAVLLGILLPVLGSAKSAGRQTVLLANQRESMRLVEAYAADYYDKFPSAGDESGVTASWAWNGETVTVDYWNQPELWAWMLQSRGYAGYVALGPNATPMAFDDREGGASCCGELGVRALHVLSPTTLARPALFHDGAGADRELNEPMRFSSVADPAAKGVLMQLHGRTEAQRSGAGASFLIHFADGHGADVRESLLKPGARIGIPFGGLPVMTTEGGVRGRDL